MNVRRRTMEDVEELDMNPRLYQIEYQCRAGLGRRVMIDVKFFELALNAL